MEKCKFGVYKEKYERWNGSEEFFVLVGWYCGNEEVEYIGIVRFNDLNLWNKEDPEIAKTMLKNLDKEVIEICEWRTYDCLLNDALQQCETILVCKKIINQEEVKQRFRQALEKYIAKLEEEEKEKLTIDPNKLPLP